MIFKVLKENEIKNYIELIIDLRLDEFKLFPYLYSGTRESELKYLSSYAEQKNSFLVLVYQEEEICGVATGFPLLAGENLGLSACKLFEENKINPNKYYYIGEIFILKKFRGKGLLRKFFELLEMEIKSRGYLNICFLTVYREEDHPLKPENYVSMDIILKNSGFVKSNMKTEIQWPTVLPNSEVELRANQLTYWTKELV